MSDSLIANALNNNDLITEHIDIWTSTVKTKSASGRGSSKKTDLYGIKKLRELILELAVRGKLVPQDPSDEPASVLLERIADEKAQLVKDKKIKKNRKQLAITQEEIYFPVPENWAYARLEDVYDVRDGTHDSPKPVSEGYPLVTSKNLSSGQLDLSEVKLISKEDHMKVIERSRVDKNDILFAMIGSIGNPVIVDTDIEFSIKNVGLFKYYNLQNSSPNYLNYFLKYASEIMKKQSAGGVQPFVSLGKLRGFVMPTPPLAEQHRIVAKVDELMALCDQLEQQTENQIDAQQTLVTVLLDTLTSSTTHSELMQNWQRLSEHFDILFTTEHSIDQLKQTILQLAVMGRLVPQDPNDEPASKLLERIAAEKAQLIKDKKIKKQKALPPISDDEKPFELPEGWEWCRLGSFWQDSFYGPRFGKEEYVSDGGYPTIRTTDMTLDGVIKLNSPPQVLISDEKLELYGLKLGDLLITRSGSIGTMALFELDTPAIPSAYLIRVRLSTYVYPKFILTLLMSPLGQAHLGVNTTAVGVPNVNATKMAQFPLPLPSLNEQVKIVSKITELFGVCDLLKSRLSHLKSTQLHLTDAIVEQVV